LVNTVSWSLRKTDCQVFGLSSAFCESNLNVAVSRGLPSHSTLKQYDIYSP